MKKRFLKLSASTALIAALMFSTNLPVIQQLIPNSSSVAYAATTDNVGPQLNVSAAAGLLIDVKSGQILWSKNMHAQRFPASVTKIMTLIVTYDAIAKGEKKLTDIVPITPDAYGVEGSSAWLDPKEQWTLQDMIDFIAIPSANDACVATADFVAGSEKAFVDRMNQKAKEIGMKDTNFMNSNGLHDPNHYTSAYDIMLMSRYLITHYPQILDISKIQTKSIRGGKTVLENTNHLLGHYDGMDGLKTGFTDQAGNNLVGTAVRNGMRLLSVELGDPDDASRVSDSATILDYGFSNYKEVNVIKKGDIAAQKAPITSGKDTETDAVAADDLVLAVKNDSPKYTTKIQYNDVTAPVKAGQLLGQEQIVQNGNVVAHVDLVAKSDVEKGSWLRLMFRGIGHFFGSIFSKIGHKL